MEIGRSLSNTEDNVGRGCVGGRYRGSEERVQDREKNKRKKEVEGRGQLYTVTEKVLNHFNILYIHL
jgi:hypothetical protein